MDNLLRDILKKVDHNEAYFTNTGKNVLKFRKTTLHIAHFYFCILNLFCNFLYFLV